MPPRKKKRLADASTDQDVVVLEFEHKSEQDIMRTGLVAFWRAGTLCDVELTVGAQTFAAHRLVLGASSPYFKSLLTGAFCESEKAVVKIEEVGASVFEAVLEYIYTRRTQVPLSMLQEILMASCRLDTRAAS